MSQFEKIRIVAILALFFFSAELLANEYNYLPAFGSNLNSLPTDSFTKSGTAPPTSNFVAPAPVSAPAPIVAKPAPPPTAPLANQAQPQAPAPAAKPKEDPPKKKVDPNGSCFSNKSEAEVILKNFPPNFNKIPTFITLNLDYGFMGAGVGGQTLRYDGDQISFESTMFSHGPGAPDEPLEQSKNIPVKEVCYDKKTHKITVQPVSGKKNLLTIIAGEDPKSVIVEYPAPHTGVLKTQQFDITATEKEYDQLIRTAVRKGTAYKSGNR